jgi:type I restriction enzyme S subunit
MSAKNTKSFYKTEIPSDWEILEMNSICSKITDGTHDTPAPIESGIPFLTALHVKEELIDFDNCYYLPEEIHKEIFRRCNPKRNDVLMVNIGAGVATTALVNVDFEFSLKNVALLKPNNEKVIGSYLNYFQVFIKPKLTQTLLNGGAQPFLSLKQIQKLKVNIPPLPEQKAIAQVLSTADAGIRTTEKLIAQKELRKKWLMQQLLTGKKRLKGFGNKIEFRVIGQYLNEVSERNKDSKVSNVLSVTNSRGFINQSDQFDRSVASEDASNYKIVRKGQFAYNPSRVNVGSLDLLRNFEIGILSPMYVVFETNMAHLLPEYFYFQLKTQWFYGHIPMFVQGSVRDSLSFDGLCSMKFFVPSLEEQTAIAHVLQVADKEISLLKAKAEKLREQKKGLMQVLLTGKVRLKIN